MRNYNIFVMGNTGYKVQPSLLFWIKLKTLSTKNQINRILQIAYVYTDMKLSMCQFGSHYVINCNKQDFQQIDKQQLKIFQQTGLYQACINSKTRIEDAQKSILKDFQIRNIARGQLLAAGKQIHLAKYALTLYMPKLHDVLHYRIFDLGSVELIVEGFKKKEKEQKKRAPEEVCFTIDMHQLITEEKNKIKRFLQNKSIIIKKNIQEIKVNYTCNNQKQCKNTQLLEKYKITLQFLILALRNIVNANFQLSFMANNFFIRLIFFKFKQQKQKLQYLFFMNSSILDDLQFVQAIETEPKTIKNKRLNLQTQNKFNQNYQTDDPQNLKVSYSTKPSRTVNSSWSQKSKSIGTRISIPSKSQIGNDSNEEYTGNTINDKYLKGMSKNDIFNCQHCIQEQLEICQICKGKRQLNGNDKLIKFFQYILEFKLGKKQSYKTKKQITGTKKTNPNQHCNIYYSAINPIFYDEGLQDSQIRYSISNEQRIVSRIQHEQKVKNYKQVHYNFTCDKCDTGPIVGIRYHCPLCQDYDLCDQCYNRNGHYHEMQRIELKNNKKCLQKIGNLLKVPVANIRSSIRNTKQSIHHSINNKICKSWIR